MDAVEQAHGVLGLVRLELADQVQRDPGVRLAQGRPLVLGLLHAVLAEAALARGDQRGDPFGRMGLAHGDQRDLGRIATGDTGGLGDPRADIGKRRFGQGVWLFHRAAL